MLFLYENENRGDFQIYINVPSKRLIYSGYWRTKHWKCLVCEKNVKSKHKFVGTKLCKAEQVKKYFVSLKIKNEVFA